MINLLSIQSASQDVLVIRSLFRIISPTYPPYVTHDSIIFHIFPPSLSPVKLHRFIALRRLAGPNCGLASRCGELQGPGRRIARLPAQQWCRFAAVQSRSPMGLTGGFNGIEIRWGFDGDLMGSSGIFSTMNSGYGRGNGNGGLTPNICWLLQ